MQVRAFKAEGLAQLSYLVSGGSEAFVVDPQLDIGTYLDAADGLGVRIAFVLETHRNEDFVSGGAALGELLDIPVYHGKHSDEPIRYATPVGDGDVFTAGKLKVTVLETPGHTKDSVCYQVADTDISDETVVIFTGDTLFVNDVGRTDFYPDEKAYISATLYDSLNKLLQLPDSVVVYPAHGAGSVCGGGMAEREFSTLGYEKRHNPRLKIDSRDDFVKAKISETHYYAPYFEKMEHYNATGKTENIEQRPLPLLKGEQWKDLMASPGDTQLVDIRSQAAFCQKHVRGSLFLSGGMVSAYGGWFLSYDQPIVLIAESTEQAKEAALQLGRMGYDKIAGYATSVPVLTGSAQDELVTSMPLVTAETVRQRLDDKQQWQLLDVRKDDEREQDAIPTSIHMYLGYLASKSEQFDKSVKTTCLCESGMRATIAASWLQHQGFTDVEVMDGSMSAWRKLTK